MCEYVAAARFKSDRRELQTAFAGAEKRRRDDAITSLILELRAARESGK